jgi:hypothetical protein
MASRFLSCTRLGGLWLGCLWSLLLGWLLSEVQGCNYFGFSDSCWFLSQLNKTRLCSINI